MNNEARGYTPQNKSNAKENTITTLIISIIFVAVSQTLEYFGVSNSEKYMEILTVILSSVFGITVTNFVRKK